MATKTKQEEVEIQAVNPEADVHHMIRMISLQNQHSSNGAMPVDLIDAHVRNWLQAGYELKSTHVLGMEPESVNVLYIFVKG